MSSLLNSIILKLNLERMAKPIEYQSESDPCAPERFVDFYNIFQSPWHSFHVCRRIAVPIFSRATFIPLENYPGFCMVYFTGFHFSFLISIDKVRDLLNCRMTIIEFFSNADYMFYGMQIYTLKNGHEVGEFMKNNTGSRFGIMTIPPYIHLVAFSPNEITLYHK